MKIWATIAVLTIGLSLALIIWLLHPPKSISMATGPENGSYAQIAKQYKQVLARDGIDLRIVYTAGSGENADLLADGRVDIALLQGGVAVPAAGPEAIGSIFFETMLFLTRNGVKVPGNPTQWRDLIITSGAAGSGTATAFRDFQTAVGLDPDANIQLHMSYDEAVEALENKEVDIAVFVSSIDAPYLQSAYASQNVAFLPLSYTSAISRRLGYAEVIVVPSGAISLNPVIPPAPQRVLALEARLVISEDLHPALVNRLTMAAKELHGNRNALADRNMFPKADGAGLPVNNAARQLIEEGPSTWHGLLPYWMAAQVNKMFLLLLPVFLIIVPFLRALPAIYAYLMG
ncbi:MAG: TAXI family TRAP transporter solute-binding subunit, partial [Pseudomonadota bacterium]